jgi:hypothetical protein
MRGELVPGLVRCVCLIDLVSRILQLTPEAVGECVGIANQQNAMLGFDGECIRIIHAPHIGSLCMILAGDFVPEVAPDNARGFRRRGISRNDASGRSA